MEITAIDLFVSRNQTVLPKDSKDQSDLEYLNSIRAKYGASKITASPKVSEWQDEDEEPAVQSSPDEDATEVEALGAGFTNNGICLDDLRVDNFTEEEDDGDLPMAYIPSSMTRLASGSTSQPNKAPQLADLVSEFMADLCDDMGLRS